MRRAMRGSESNDEWVMVVPRPNVIITPELAQQLADIPLPDQHLAFKQYSAQKPAGAAASALQIIKSMYSSSYSKDQYGVEMTFFEQLQKLASADPAVSSLCNLLLAKKVPRRARRQLTQLLSQNLSEMAKALSKGISMVATSKDVPWYGNATAIDTVGALTSLLSHTFAASMPTTTGDATLSPHLLGAQQLARTGLFVEVARACSSTAAQLTSSALKAAGQNNSVGQLRLRIEFAGVLLRLFVQLATHWPGRALAGDTISQCAEPAAELAAAVLKLGGAWPGVVTNTSIIGSASRGNVAGVWPAARQYAFAVAHVLVKELCAEARLATHDGSFDHNSSQLSRVTKSLLGSASMWYLQSAHLGVEVAKFQQQQQQQQSQNPQQPGSQTLQPHHLKLLQFLGIDQASLSPQETGQWPNIHNEWASWSDTVITLATAVADHITANAGEGPVLPCRAVVPVVLTILELSHCAQGSEVLWDSITLVHDLMDMCLLLAGQLRFEDEDLQNVALSCCRAHKTEPAVAAEAEVMAVALFKPVLRLLPMLTSTMKDSISQLAASSSGRNLHLSSQQKGRTTSSDIPEKPRAWEYATLVSRVLPHEAITSGRLLGSCDRDLLPALEFSVRAAAEYWQWALATGARWCMYGPDCDSNCITTAVVCFTLAIAAAIVAPRPTEVGGSLSSAYGVSRDAYHPSDDAAAWRPLQSHLISCLKVMSQHHSELSSIPAQNRARAVTKLLQIVATSKAKGISGSGSCLSNNPASSHSNKATDITLLIARSLIVAGDLLIELCKLVADESSRADSQPVDRGLSDRVANLIAEVMLPSVADACGCASQQLQQMAAGSPRPPGTLAGVLLELAGDGQQLAASITAAAAELSSLGGCDSLQDSGSTGSSSNIKTSATETCARHVSMTPGVQADLQNSIGPKLQSFGSAVCAQLPVGHCCNNPQCVITSHMSEQALVGGKGCVCTGCKVARYCGRDCQLEHWPEHKAVCKRIKVVRRAATSD